MASTRRSKLVGNINYAPDFITAIENSASKLAGCYSFPTTASLHKIYSLDPNFKHSRDIIDQFAADPVPKLQTSTTSTVATTATASSVENAIILNSIQIDPINTEDTFPLDIDLLDMTLFDGAPYLSLLTGIAYALAHPTTSLLARAPLIPANRDSLVSDLPADLKTPSANKLILSSEALAEIANKNAEKHTYRDRQLKTSYNDRPLQIPDLPEWEASPVAGGILADANEIQAHFGNAFTLWVFHGFTGRTGDTMRKKQTLNTLTRLREELALIDTNDSATSRTIILNHDYWNEDDLDIADEDNDQVPSSLPSSLLGTPPMMSACQEVVEVLAVLQDNDTSGLSDPEAALEKS
ncbi:hypothetical protein PENANT_c284G06663 [Penicillium antarcticum]|uniref:Uncharacterized protein n=1 Tax=Penicillium antarcticum TaxID=416450 RepID=A0A1V6NYW6_9EURO|nr:hypothetical protein PENANT_c284G06663 [Penicillium antarcticum]